MTDLEKSQMKNNVVVIDYNGIHVSFTTDAWFNATEVAKRFGKRPVDWLRLDETQSYLKALSAALGISEPKSLIQAKRNSGKGITRCVDCQHLVDLKNKGIKR